MVAAGAALMAWGPDLMALSIGRRLIGVGVSAYLILQTVAVAFYLMARPALPGTASSAGSRRD
jgi:hypothetical protein